MQRRLGTGTGITISIAIAVGAAVWAGYGRWGAPPDRSVAPVRSSLSSAVSPTGDQPIGPDAVSVRLVPAPAWARFESVREEVDAHGQVQRRMVANRVLVGLQPGCSFETATDEVVAHWAANGLTPQRRLRVHDGREHWLIELNDPSRYRASLAWLQAQGEFIAFAEPDSLVTAASVFSDDPELAGLWGLHNTGQTGGTDDADIDAPEAWNTTTGSRAVLVGIIDSGIDYQHPDLVANIWTNPGESGTDAMGNDRASNGIDDDGNGYIDDVHGWDFIDDDNQPFDTWLHGTHVAGTVGAVGDNNRNGVGVAWQVSLVPIRAIDFFVNGGAGTTSDAIEGLDYATAMGVHITTNSYGGQEHSEAMRAAIERAETAGVLFIASSGNETRDNDQRSRYPSSYGTSNVIAVAASDHNDDVARFDQPAGVAGGDRSNIGQTSVDLAAPGNRIFSTYPTYQTDFMADNDYATGYGFLSGTSMSVPHVAGVAALVKAQHPAFDHHRLKGVLLNSVDQPSAWAGAVASAGRLNANQALALAEQATSEGVMALMDWQWLDNGLGGSSGNGNGELNPGETIALRARLRNIGSATLAAGSLDLDLTDGDGLTLDAASGAWAEVAPDAEITIDLLIAVAADAAAGGRAATLRFNRDVSGPQRQVPIRMVVEPGRYGVRWEPITALNRVLDDADLTADWLVGDDDEWLVSTSGNAGAVGIYRSTDAGATWARVSIPEQDSSSMSLNLTPMLRASATGEDYYFSSRGVWRSSDGGASWARTNGPNFLNFSTNVWLTSTNLLWRRDETELWTLGANRVISTADQGDTWRIGERNSAPADFSFSEGISTGTVLAGGRRSTFGSATTTDMQIWRSTDDGVTWNRASGGTHFQSSTIVGIVADPVTPGRLIAADSAFNPASYSDDDGQTWTFMDATEGANQAILAVTANGVLPDGVLMLTRDGFPAVGDALFSENGGASWARLGDGFAASDLPAPSWHQLTQIGSDQTIFAVGDFGVYRLMMAVNRAPQADDQVISTAYQQPVDITVTGSDPDGDTWSAIIDALPANGRLQPVSNGQWRYLPSAGFSGDDTFTFRTHDGIASSALATVTIQVAAAPPPNTAPVITQGEAVSVRMSEDGVPTAWSLDLSASDADDDTLTWSIVALPGNGSATLTSRNTSTSIGYEPARDFNGTDQFTVHVGDGNGGVDTIVVSVVIDPINDAPVMTTPPSLSGSSLLGQVITADVGGWNDSLDGGSTITYAYQWWRADNAAGANAVVIADATTATYTLQAADSGRFIRVTVTASDNGVGAPAVMSANASSTWFGPVATGSGRSIRVHVEGMADTVWLLDDSRRLDPPLSVGAGDQAVFAPYAREEDRRLVPSLGGRN